MFSKSKRYNYPKDNQDKKIQEDVQNLREQATKGEGEKNKTAQNDERMNNMYESRPNL